MHLRRITTAVLSSIIALSMTTKNVFADTPGKITASKLNVRSGPSTSHKSIASISKNNSVTIIQESNGWYKVKLSNGSTGWVSGKYVSKNSKVQQSPPSRGSRSIGQNKVDSTVLNSVKTQPKDLATNDNIGYVKVIISLDSYISSQVKRTSKSAEALKPYIDPKNYAINNKETFMQFLKLNKFRQIDVNKLNAYLNNLKVNSGKTNIFYNQGQAFVNTAKRYNIDPVYLVAHTLVETGFGMSSLAQGYEVLLESDGKASRNGTKVKLKDSSTPSDSKTVKVYNLFGIGAVDSSVIPGGTTTAYDNNWTSMPNAIDGSAKWITENYIYRSGHAQDTLYKMRYNYVDKWHQYATDIGWATKISKHLNNLSYLYIGTNLDFEVPVYK
jgi:beta-N-acetylglucosaminidase